METTTKILQSIVKITSLSKIQYDELEIEINKILKDEQNN